MKLRYLIASTVLVFSLFFVPAVANAVTDTTLAKPVLQRYDLGGNSFVPPYNDVVNLQKGEKITLAGKSQPGGRVTVIIGNKSIVTDGVANGTWAKTIETNDLPAGADTIVAQTVVGDRTSELANLLKINVTDPNTAKNESMPIYKNPYLLGGLGLLVLAGALFFLNKKYKFIGKK